MSRRMRSRCQYYSAKPLSKRVRSRRQDECEADVNIMRSLCQEECETDVSIILRSRCQSQCEADVRMNAKPMSIWCEAYVKVNAKPMSRRMRSRCQGDSEADVEKAFTRAHTEWKYTRTQRVPCELGGKVSDASWVGTCGIGVAFVLTSASQNNTGIGFAFWLT